MVPHIVWTWIGSILDENPTGWFVRSFSSTDTQMWLGLVAGLMVNVPVTIMAGDLFTRTVVKQCMGVFGVGESLLHANCCRREEMSDVHTMSEKGAGKHLHG